MFFIGEYNFSLRTAHYGYTFQQTAKGIAARQELLTLKVDVCGKKSCNKPLAQ